MTPRDLEMTRMSTPFNKLTEPEVERLALLLEECGECQQIIGKVLRHGYESFDPTVKVPDDENPTTNRMLLEKELGDVFHAIDRMAFSRDVKFERITDHANAKIAKVERYLHHQHATGYTAARKKYADPPATGTSEEREMTTASWILRDLNFWLTVLLIFELLIPATPIMNFVTGVILAANAWAFGLTYAKQINISNRPLPAAQPKIL